MTLTDRELIFVSTPATVILGAVLFFAAVVLAAITWKRSQYSLSTGLLELLRVVIVAFVCLTLNQPEWRETFEPDEMPSIAFLRDESASMTTEDIRGDDSSPQSYLSRSSIAETYLLEDQWEPLKDEFSLAFQSFSNDSGDKLSGTDISAALKGVTEQFNNLRGVVLISDGDWNTGDPPSRAAALLRMQQIPVFAIPVGSETRLPDLEVSSFDIPTFGISGKPVRLPFTLSSSLPRTHSTTVTISTEAGETLTKTVEIPAMGRLQDSILWTPQSEQDYELTLTLPLGDTEYTQTNNSLTAPISIRREELKVLLIESFPRWEYRYIRNALERDPGVEVSCLLFHPGLERLGDGEGYLESFPNEEELTQFDVIFLGDVGVSPEQLTLDHVAALKDQIANQAAGLVLMPGFRGYHYSLINTELEPLFPVILDNAQRRGWGSSTPGQFELTELGARSLLTRLEDSESANASIWSSLPGFQWFAGVSRSKAGSEVLATHSSETNQYGRIPLIVTKTYGTGKILFMGTDGAWRWRKGVEDKYHYRFWGQVARWMAYQRNMASDELMRLFYSPDRPMAGETLAMNANVMSIGGEPLQTATVIVQIISPSGRAKSVRLQPGGEEQWGLFTGTYEPSEPGNHELIMTCAENGGRLETSIAVQGGEIETVGDPARHEVLEEIAQITKGELLARPDIATIQERLSLLSAPDPIEYRLRLWAHPAWIGTLIGLLTLFWIGRKAIGAV